MPSIGNGMPPQTALALRGQQELGLPWDASAQAPQGGDDVLDLRDLWRLVVKHKWMLVSVAIVGLLAALLLSFVRTPQYLASTTLQVDKRAARVVKFGQDEQGGMQDVDERTRMGTQLELLQSRVLAERVIDELGLDRQGLLQAVPRKLDEKADRRRSRSDSTRTTPAGWRWSRISPIASNRATASSACRPPTVSSSSIARRSSRHFSGRSRCSSCAIRRC